MVILKNRDIAADIKVTGVDLGNIGAKFYTEDENTASITLYIKYNGLGFDLTQSAMKPKLDLFTLDGSIFLDEPLEVVDSTSGIIKYTIQPDVIKHVGSVNAKLFLTSENESVHVANFQFDIGDSGIDKAIAKQIDVNLIDNAIMSIIEANPDRFRGEAFTFEDFTSEQLESLKVKGDEGSSAYEVWLQQGNTDKTVNDYLLSLKGLDGSKVTIGSDGYWYIDGIKQTTMAKPSQAEIDNMKLYVQSRGQNLVTNGTGLLGDNTNFSGFTYKQDEVKVGRGSFYTGDLRKTYQSDEFIPVDPSKSYLLSAWVKSKKAISQQYFGHACYDIDRNAIYPENLESGNYPVAKLTKPLKVGDTIIYLDNVSAWADSSWTLTNDKKGVILWGYKDSKGYLFADRTYSRYNKIGIQSVDVTNNTITLSSAWDIPYKDTQDGVFPIGHSASRTNKGGNYNYSVLSKVVVPATWTNYSGKVLGIGGSEATNVFRYGTTYIKLLFISNYDVVDEVWYSGIDFRESVETNPEWTDAILQNGYTGSVKYYKDRNSLVTVKFDLTVGLVAAGTVIASIPSNYLPTVIRPVPSYNITTNTPDLFINITTTGVAVGKTLTQGNKIQGQITYRVG
ncbi:BppU family phage baseplate upper protein [Macrococcus carouselicus]|uniref:Phage baseplate upper protein n=1 Tax=Macrococcus carouselicus TaxID=69969 RepID=A0A9Q8FQV0_9STAP|nr:BppU family phage baseplate upper protein [Macrococcus carouselicus]TDM04073.1 phage baseplate upper protein [Macrococcus carouselicus]